MELECGCDYCCSCREREDSRIACLSDKEFIWEFGKKTWLQYNAEGKNLSNAYKAINEWNQWLEELKESYE